MKKDVVVSRIREIQAYLDYLDKEMEKTLDSYLEGYISDLRYNEILQKQSWKYTKKVRRLKRKIGL